MNGEDDKVQGDDRDLERDDPLEPVSPGDDEAGVEELRSDPDSRERHDPLEPDTQTRGIPKSRIGRSARLGTAIGGQATRYAGTMAANVARSEERSQERLESRHLESALKMASVLGEMKGAAMKIGQMASFIDTDFLPPEYREIYQKQLSKLRTHAPAMPWDKVQEILADEYDDSPERVFASTTRSAITVGTSASANASGENHESVFSRTSAIV